MKSMAVELLVFGKSMPMAGLKEVQRMVWAWIRLQNYLTTQDR
jgi:hypothetical protein